MKCLPVWTVLLATLTATSSASAQNVSNYGAIPEPLLFLLREPAVRTDLGLSGEQEKRLVEFNESVDGILLATRNMPPEEAQKQIGEVMTNTREHVQSLFSSEQQTRLQQIAYRLRGISFVLAPQASRDLRLTQQQKTDIETAVKATLETVAKSQSGTYQGKEAHQASQREIAAARKEEQETILATLDDKQKQDLLALVGRQFDPRNLGRVSFKAPEFSAGDQWINSEPLTLKDLRGKVVALHFWAFG